MSLDIGQVYTGTLTVVDGTGNPDTPTGKTLTLTLPGKARTTVDLSSTITTVGQGRLSFDYLLANPGLHRFDWITTGPGTAQTDFINARSFASLGSLAEMKAHLGVVDTSKDQIIRLIMGVATRHVERICGTCIIRDFTNVWIPGDYRDVIRLTGGPLPDDSSVTQIASVWDGGPVWSASDIIVNPAASTVRLRSFLPFWFGPWKASFTAGRVEIPEDLVHGWKEIGWDLWAEYRGLTSDTDLPDLTEVAQFENTIANMANSGYRLSPRALQHLEGERRPGFA